MYVSKSRTEEGIFAMSFSHTITYQFSSNGAPATLFTSSNSFDGQVDVSVDVPAASSNFSIVCPVNTTLLQSLVIWTTGACTVLTKDSGGTTLDTLTFGAANQPLIWNVSSPGSNPLSGTIATLAVTCTPAVTVNAYFGLNV